MNKRYIRFIPVAALALSLGACSEDMGPRPDVPDMSGKEVNFSLNVAKNTKTYYGQDSWGTNAEDASIFWGDPFNNSGEEVIVYGKYAGRNVGHYAVSGYGTPDSSNLNGGQNTAKTLTKKGDMGVQWGEKPEDSSPVTFFSVYPANGGDYMNQGDPANGKFRANLISEQTPVGYSLDPSLLSPASKPTEKRTIVAYPNMDGAVMVAQNTVEYGAEQVSLNYKVITNVLDVTVFGPTRALLNSADANYVDIYSVYIKSIDGTAIAGEFDYDVNQETPEKATTIASGNTQSQITLNFNKTTSAGAIVYPRLYNYATSGSTTDDVYTPNEVDQLRFRAFLLPGVEPKNLEITVNTNLGQYQLKNGQLAEFPSSFTAGNIHRMKLPMLNKTGRSEYDYSRWMEQINPDIYATELSIPGAWNSFQLVSGADVSTTVGETTKGYQVSDYLDQYKRGVRAFVLRVAAFTDGSSHAQNPTGTDIRVQTGWGWGYSDYGYTLNDVLNQLGARVNGTKEFIVLILRGVGTAPYVTFEGVKDILDKNDYVYKGGITPTTTVGELHGKILVKLNVQNRPEPTDKNYPEWQGEVPAVGSGYPALFAQWMDGYRDKSTSVPLEWGGWNTAYLGNTTDAGTTGMKWCFSECDNIKFVDDVTTNTNVATIEERKQAIDSFIEQSLQEYKAGDHNIWMYLVVGGNRSEAKSGDTSAYTATNYAAEVTTALNTYTYEKLSVAGREPCPMGIVMMNYATSTNAAYNSANLIRTIINNNNAFVMKKKTGTSTDNSSNTSILNGGSAIKSASRRR